MNIDEFFHLSYWVDLLHTQLFNANFWINMLDIAVVWFLVYRAVIFLKGTKAMHLIKGIAIILVIRILSGWIGLNTISWLMDQVITYGVIAAIIIFQPEIRRGLEHLGRGTLFKKRQKDRWRNEENKSIQAYDKSIQYMSRRRIGALITIQRETSLDEYIETGIPIDADITGELLINIFIPNTPLHDGAVIIKDNKIAVACAYLPLSESMMIPKEFGTRHRAAVGVSEVSDAITIVVSEETGDVSLTYNGELHHGLSQEEYLEILHQKLDGRTETISHDFDSFFSRRKGGN